MSANFGPNKRDADGTLIKTERDVRKSTKIQNGIREWEEIQQMWRIAGQQVNTEPEDAAQKQFEAMLVSIQSKIREGRSEFEKLGFNIPKDDPQKAEARYKLGKLKHSLVHWYSKEHTLREFKVQNTQDLLNCFDKFVETKILELKERV